MNKRKSNFDHLCSLPIAMIVIIFASTFYIGRFYLYAFILAGTIRSPWTCWNQHNKISILFHTLKQVKSFDERAGKIIYEWELHEQRVNTIDFHPENSNLIATSSSDSFVRLWDLRCIDKDKPKSIREISHNRAVHSAYFSPTGNGIVSTRYAQYEFL